MRDMRIHALAAAYREGSLTPLRLVEELLFASTAWADRNIWIVPPDVEVLRARARRLEADGPEGKPLWGIPFVVKDNIDVAGLPTTAACKAFAHDVEASAPVVQTLLDAGAILVGKTNLDQFATGLNGTRSDYGICRNAFDPAYLAGGSSSGSAVAVALGLASFSLGTDTAGSGRVPASFNNLVGLKPTRGLLSTRGVLPACRSLDCVSIFALTAADAEAVFEVCAVFDAGDAYARLAQPGPLPAAGPQGLRIAVPRAGVLAADCDEAALAAHARALDALVAQGAVPVEVDVAPFLEAALLLYEGPWVAERYAAIRDFFDTTPEAVHPVVRTIIARARDYDACAAFEADYRLMALRRQAEAVWAKCDALLLPTAPTHYTVDAVLADPLTTNSRLGRYTNFVNLLDLAAVAVPAGQGANGLPVGVTLLATAFSDRFLLSLAASLQPALNTRCGREIAAVPAAPDTLEPPAGCYALAVVGAHMSGLPLNHELTSRGARFLRRTQTAPTYRFYALEGKVARPGLVAVASGGARIEAEIWAMPQAALGSFLAGIPAPLGLGKLTLDDGSEVIGFICEGGRIGAARDITTLGGWRAYLAEKLQRIV
ncbi:MAG: allophanate hydrolase [Hydrogenophilales bacterium 16-64-46]|nr:MAG: allophanate hydrolase [Hydrogenophilales bacterium 12-64-13]OYZ05006.1 MAG: allophanate hydrolase [Hydrogenophilales bacterium 16-64-46]OZA36757.1 MAG: allophanate hydrolase [Hydrogenophilales bacterium 17-64-34]HQT01109.1 allophanate hydrolase [Thiobacillus sp.]